MQAISSLQAGSCAARGSKCRLSRQISPLAPRISFLMFCSSRRVSRIRNFNERGFGRLTRRWGILRRPLPPSLVPSFKSIYRLLLAVDNAYSAPLWSASEHDESDRALFVNRGNEHINIVQELVQRKPKFRAVEPADFIAAAPADLNLTALRRWNGGPYAINLEAVENRRPRDLRRPPRGPRRLGGGLRRRAEGHV